MKTKLLFFLLTIPFINTAASTETIASTTHNIMGHALRELSFDQINNICSTSILSIKSGELIEYLYAILPYYIVGIRNNKEKHIVYKKMAKIIFWLFVANRGIDAGGKIAYNNGWKSSFRKHPIIKKMIELTGRISIKKMVYTFCI